MSFVTRSTLRAVSIYQSYLRGCDYTLGKIDHEAFSEAEFWLRNAISDIELADSFEHLLFALKERNTKLPHGNIFDTDVDAQLVKILTMARA